MEDYLIEAALRVAQQGDLPHARRLLEMQVERYPQVGEGWYLLCRLLSHSGDISNGPSELERLYPWNPAAPSGPDRSSTPVGASESGRIMARGTSQAVNRTTRSVPPVPAAGTRQAHYARATNPTFDSNLHALLAMVRWFVFGLTALFLLFVGSATFPMVIGGRTFVIVSGSMEPSIPKGAAAIALPVSSRDLSVGDVIVYSPSPQAALPIVHRIVKIDERGAVRRFTTRGDANQTADATEFSLSATAWRVWYNVPVAGYLISFAAKPMGTLAAIVFPRVSLLALNLPSSDPLDLQIDVLYAYFDSHLTPTEILPWLGAWVDLVLDESWPEA
jgi:signal peptidase I